MQGDIGVLYLEDVGPAAQLVGEGGAQPTHDVLADVKREGGKLLTRGGGVGAGSAREGQEVVIDAGSHGGESIIARS